MISKKRRRLNLMLTGLMLLITSAVLVGYGMRDGIEFFKSPSQVISDSTLVGKKFRLGGLVKSNSIEKLTDGTISFIIHDNLSSVSVSFDGILPALFAEEQGVIVRGSISEENIFYADEVLAKHDENYLPKEIIDTLKDQGVYVENN